MNTTFFKLIGSNVWHISTYLGARGVGANNVYVICSCVNGERPVFMDKVEELMYTRGEGPENLCSRCRAFTRRPM